MDLIQAAYFVVAILFIVGLKRMAHPTTAKSGIVWAGWGMVLAVLATFFWPGMGNFALILLALLLGSAVAWWAAVRVAMTDMPQMVAIYNGMGGGAAAAISGVELLGGGEHSLVFMALAVLGGIIGSIAPLGMAVALDRGLIVPVIKNAGDLNIAGLARGIAELAERTRGNRITPDDLAGGTFTITNTSGVTSCTLGWFSARA